MRFLILVFFVIFPATYAYAQGGRLDFEQGVRASQAGNHAEAFCIWKPLADVGHSEAQYRLGWLYAKGLGLAVDEAVALYWWQQAAKLGHRDALFRLGWAYAHGEGADRDMRQAVTYYLQAARHQQEDAIEVLHEMFMRDNKVVLQGIGAILQDNVTAMGTLHAISVERANVRRGANKNKTLLLTLSKGDEVVVLGNKANWLRVWVVESQSFGWIFNRLVSGYETGSK